MIKFFLGVVFVGLVSFSVNPVTSEKASATVNQQQGVYLFVDSKPVSEYEYLGTIQIKHSKYGPQYEPVRDALLKELKKKYPQADGAIFHFANDAIDKADAIKFK